MSLIAPAGGSRVVESVAFRGTHTDYELSASIGRVAVRVGGPARHALGERVGLTIERLWLPGA